MRELAVFLRESNLENKNTEDLLKNSAHGVSLGLAFSGGSYRSMFAGAGLLAALDKRMNFKGGLGGLLQSSTYITGLSGGAWLVGSEAMSGWPTISETVLDNPAYFWNVTKTKQVINITLLAKILIPAIRSDLKGIFSHLNYYHQGILRDVKAKEDAGFRTSFTDYWGRGISHHLLTQDADDYGTARTWLDLRDAPWFKNHEMPFPVLVALAREPGSLAYNSNTTIVEMNPFELGSFDPSINAFTDIRYLGTNVSNGLPVNGSRCISGFDNSGFLMGTSSSIFNQFLLTIVCEKCTALKFPIKNLARHILKLASKTLMDIAIYSPNPFYDCEFSSSKKMTQNHLLLLFDGGLAGESVPLLPLLAKQRGLDIVFAFDSASDTDQDWPSGLSLRATYERQFTKQGNSLVCPHVPDAATFLERNLTARPTFFGCDTKNMTSLVKDGVFPPLVVYIANRPDLFFSNTSIYKLTYSDRDKKSMVRNGIEIATMMNSTFDPEWRSCVACAVIKREEERQSVVQLEQCKRCFSKYCWDGVYAEGGMTHKVNFTDTGLTNEPMALRASSDPQPQYIPGIFGMELERKMAALEVVTKSSSGSRIRMGSWAVATLVIFLTV